VPARIRNLPSAFEGYKIGFLTDIHLGMWLPNDWVVQALEMLTNEAIDLLVLGGDYIFLNDNPLWRETGIIRNQELAEHVPRKAIPMIYTALGTILSRYSFPDGVVAVAGNHDHWNSTSVFLSIFGSLPGIELLINRERVIARRDHFGVDDFLTGIPAAPPNDPLRSGQDVRVIISHNPDYMSAVTKYLPNYHFDLALCGHTHGGQIRVPPVGAFVCQISDPRFISGLVHLGERSVYTSRGLGFVGLPIRINCPPEVTVFTLERT
jgi:predicted MPP superfamily phosphohydrolase